MPKLLSLLLLSAALASAVLSPRTRIACSRKGPSRACPAPRSRRPSFPAGPRLPGGPAGGSGNYAVSAAANEHAAFLWVVDNIQHAVVLCEKSDGGRDFACTKKPLP